MKLFILCSLLLFTTQVFSQKRKSVILPTNTAAKSQTTNNQVNSDILIKEFDQQKGAFIGLHNTADDGAKISLIYHISPSISFSSMSNIADISTFEINYTNRSDNTYWINYLLERTTAKLDAISDIKSDATDTILTLGIGLYQRFKLFDNYFKNDLLFESIEANITYNTISSDISDETYQGIGLKSDFTIFYRSTTQIHYGVRFSYNLISSKSKSGQPHTISWVSTGLELGLYF